MSIEVLLGLVMFSLVSSITPGPNNLMLMSSGANFGFRRTIPHMLGVGIGFTLMVLLIGVGVAQVFQQFPVAYLVLKVVSCGYLLFLAWKIATAAEQGEGDKKPEPITFLQAALFQWVNPKAWTMALTAITVYSPSPSLTAVASVAFIFGMINLPCISLWTTMGLHLRRFLNRPGRLKSFNALMGLLLVGSLYPVVFP